MAQCLRCPGGRPSVSYNWVKMSQQSQKLKRTNTNHIIAVSRRVQGAGKGGLFLGRLDQGLVGNAESTHVDRPKGKVLQYLKNTYIGITRRVCSARWENLVKVGIYHIVSDISEILMLRDDCETVVECWTWGRSLASTTRGNNEALKNYAAQKRVKRRQQQEKTRPNKELSEIEIESPADSQRTKHWQEPWKHRRPPQYKPFRIGMVKHERGYWERFFFDQCCARHYNCGSHEAVLK